VLSRRKWLGTVAGVAALGVLPLPGSGSSTTGPDPPVPAATGPVRLLPIPNDVASACRRVQAGTRKTVLCPSLLPRAFLRELGFPPPFLQAHPAGFGSGPASGLDISYGAPWEPDSGSGWQRHLWRNRACCFFHFDVYRRPNDRRSIPATARPATVGGLHGLLKPAAGYGLGCSGSASLYWCNHVAFLWQDHGGAFVASLHNFGPGTVQLLGRLVAGLRPANRLPRTRPRGLAVGVSPNSIRSAGGELWVAALGDRTSNFRGTIFHVDARRGRVVSLLHPGPGPHGLAYGHAALWTITYAGIARVDPRTGRRLAVIDTGRWPRAIAVGRRWAWVVDSTPFVARGSLVRIDPATNRVVGRPLGLGRAPVAVAVGPGAVWIADELDGTLTRVDSEHRRVVARITVGRGPTSVVVGAGSVWVANTGEATVSRVDPARNRVTATIRVGLAPRGLVVSRGSVWVASTASGTVWRIDPRTNRATVAARGLGDPLALAVADGRLWITTNGDGRLLSRPVR
jgi:YVTN family beta-propeller protein